MAIENNPLKQYFRRPSIYIRLPSGGKQYGTNIVDLPDSEEIPVFPMTAIDEISAKTPDALYSGQAVVDIIRSCVPAIKDPWKINAVDLDAILIAIKTATEGNKQEILSECPSCSEQSNYEMNLITALQTMTTKGYENELSLGELKVKFKPLSYRDLNSVNKEQFEVEKLFQQIDALTEISEKTNKTKELVIVVTKAAMKALSLSIEYIQTPNAKVETTEYILDYVQNCDKTTFDVLKDFNIKLKKQTEMKPMKITCPACSHQYEQPYTLNITDFFG